MKDYVKDFDGLITDISVGYSSTITVQSIHRMFLENEDIQEMVNQQWAFWVRTINCHISNVVICLGKVFDENKKSLSIDRLVKWVEKNPNEFSIASIKERRIRNGEMEVAVDQYMKGCHVFELTDFKALRAKAYEVKDMWNEEGREARNKVFAHRDSISFEEMNALLESLSFDYLELLYSSANGIQTDVQKALLDGRKFSLETLKYHDEQITLKHLRWVVEKCMKDGF